ncbi:MAG: undecaprenyl-diphosphate phosphatase [Candidatus Korarchaeota archaeon]|nr:undecaprenyl-diphosphate phosphatase [Candidatus Korarchaeota archaeon]NIU84165.1 hypothetical protein [Candidatus Thorarchaeota archaeon]NIW14310.1 hypothetical protein [Candidatus Thorarchaeota archaeon]NIW52407.1 hypothetical protein [Candidatus Korarchaeota archaeon]
MNLILIYLILGILQGIFEWIPISSEGILALASKFLLKEKNPIDVALFLHLGTLIAIVVYFRKAWKDVLRYRNRHLLRFLILATMTALPLGFLIYSVIRSSTVGNTLLLLMGGGLFFTAFFQKKGIRLHVNEDQLAVIAGALQGLAVIPGVSRSGATIFGLSLGNVRPPETLRISYMMSTPVIVAAIIYLLFKNPALLIEGWPALISSALVGYFSLHILLHLSQKVNFFKFALSFAVVCIIGATIGFISGI